MRGAPLGVDALLAMDPELAVAEKCAMCSRPAAGASAFCRLYESGRAVPLCSPTCVRAYLYRQDHPLEAPPIKSLDELVASLRWEHGAS
jgi:hypothetical protein